MKKLSEKRNLTKKYINVKYDSLINEINNFENEEDNIKFYNKKKKKKNKK